MMKNPRALSPFQQRIVDQALRIMEERVENLDYLSSPSDVRNYLRLRYAQHGHEVFGVVLLDAQHRVITCEEMFRGSLTQTSVYPREVAKLALASGAAAVVLFHNHPSGEASPSSADVKLTSTLKDALQLLDIRVLDHVVVAMGSSSSLAEQGLI